MIESKSFINPLQDLTHNSTKVVVFTDLDDSLFQSRRKCLDKELGEELGNLSVAAYDRQGTARSFHTSRQRALLRFWHEATWIPVTGRSSDALSRVASLEWSSYRIVSHGAQILDINHNNLTSWQIEIESEIQDWTPRLLHAYQQVLDEVNQQALKAKLSDSEVFELPRVRLIYEGEEVAYLSIKGSQDQLNTLRQILEPHWEGGVIHHNDRDMALLPSYASKARAVAHLLKIFRKQWGDELLVMGLGDSISDLSFLKLCDFALTPQASQIQKECW